MFADLVHDYVKPYTVELNGADLEKLNGFYDEMAQSALESLKREGVSEESISIIRTAEIRYVAQFREIEVPIPFEKVGEKERAQLKEIFDKKHEELLLFSTPQNPAQFISLRLKAIGAMAKPELPTIGVGEEDPSAALKSERECFFGKSGLVLTPIYDGDRLLAGNVIEGPSIVEETTTTVVLPPSCRCRVGTFGDYVIEIV
jgi:N-methylhydantoinase A